MTTLSATDQNMRRAFRYLNKFMILMWRLGLGWMLNMWPSVGGRIMVIAHTGHKSGKRRLAPVNYAIVDGKLYCTAGFGRVAHWYRNIMAIPDIEVWLPDSRWYATAHDVSDDPDRLRLLRQVLIGSGKVAALVGVDPATLSDEELAAKTGHYRLIYLQRTSPATGPGGPGDLSWIWPTTTLLLVLRCRRRG